MPESNFAPLSLAKKIDFLKKYIPKYVNELTLGFQAAQKKITFQQQAQQTIAALAALPKMTTAQLKELSKTELEALQKALATARNTIGKLQVAASRVQQ